MSWRARLTEGPHLPYQGGRGLRRDPTCHIKEGVAYGGRGVR